MHSLFRSGLVKYIPVSKAYSEWGKVLYKSDKALENGVGGSPWPELSSDLKTKIITKSTAPEDSKSKCVVPPIVTSSIFMMEGSGSIRLQNEDDPANQLGVKKYEYGRLGNPTRNHLENYLRELEDSRYALTFGSGMAALSAVFLSLKQGDHIVSIKPIYGGTIALMNKMSQYGVSVSYVLESTTSEIIKHVQDNTKMIFLESPSNPTLNLVDIAEIAKAAHEKHKDLLVVVDNTFLTPLYQRCLELGADVSVYSLSKYIGGHSDIIMGAVTTNSTHVYERVHVNQEMIGGIPSPFDCYLASRSLKTLGIRMRQIFENAMKVARFLESHPKVKSVVYPGLPSHPQYELALKQQKGNSGMIGLYIKGGLNEAAKFLESVKVFRRAPSLGADNSLATIPGRMSHMHLPEEERNRLGITDNFIRLSVGLEGSENLISDLNQALNKIA